MADNLTNIIIPQNKWIDLYDLSGITVGEIISVENVGDCDIHLAVQAAEPSKPHEAYNLIARRGYQYRNNLNDSGAWAFCQGSEGKISIRESANENGFYPYAGNIEGVVTALTLLQSFIEQGKAWGSTESFVSLTDDGVKELLIITGSAKTVLGVAIEVVGDFEFLVYEAPTISNNGTLLPSYNLDRPESVFTPFPVSIAYIDPIITVDGLQLAQTLILGGTKKDAIADSKDTVFKAKENTAYLFRFINRSGEASNGNIAWVIGEDGS